MPKGLKRRIRKNGKRVDLHVLETDAKEQKEKPEGSNKKDQKTCLKVSKCKRPAASHKNRKPSQKGK